MNNKVLILGNSSSVLNYKFGDIINSFEHVVRFNNFEINGFEEFVGTKTTILARRACDDVRLWNSETLKSVLVFVTYCKWYEGMRFVASQLKGYYQGKQKTIDVDECKRLANLAHIDHPIKEWASVGLLAVAYLTEQYGKDRIVLHGFDFLKDGTGHYFPKPPKDGFYHNSLKEEAYINSLNLQTLVEYESSNRS